MSYYAGSSYRDSASNKKAGLSTPSAREIGVPVLGFIAGPGYQPHIGLGHADIPLGRGPGAFSRPQLPAFNPAMERSVSGFLRSPQAVRAATALAQGRIWYPPLWIRFLPLIVALLIMMALIEIARRLGYVLRKELTYSPPDFSGYTQNCLRAPLAASDYLGLYSQPSTTTCTGIGMVAGAVELAPGTTPPYVVEYWKYRPTGNPFPNQPYPRVGYRNPLPNAPPVIRPLVWPLEWPADIPWPQVDPRPRVQPNDPFTLPILEPWPQPEPLPWENLPYRQPRPERSPTEQPQRGPQAPPNPRPDVDPHPRPVIAPAPAPGPQGAPSREMPDLSAAPGGSPEAIIGGLVPSVPGVPGPEFHTDGKDFQWKPDRGGRPRPGKPKDRKNRITVAKLAVKLAKRLGSGTEALDLLESLWDAIPKRECGPGQGPAKGPAKEGGETCGGNVSDCKGKKIKYNKPLAKAPRKWVKGDDGQRHSQVTRNAYGKPITHPRPQEMLRDIKNHWGELDLCSAVENILKNEAEDQLYGRVSRKASKKFQEATKRPFGPGVGPAM